VRGIARSSVKTLGNFWVDLVRITYYLLLPVCVVFAIFLVSQGMIQNFDAYTKATTLEGAEQVIAQGPMASQVAIKMLGTNGGGFMNANAAHPFENPTPLSNFIQMLSIFAIGSGLDLLPRPHGEEPGARLGGVGRDDGALRRRRARLLLTSKTERGNP
jgi:K+-transporting ATPase ATPase A chain